MITIQRTVTTDSSLDRVFAFLADFTNAPQWDAGTVACTLVSGDGGVGTAYLNTSKFMGRETQLTYVVQQVEHNGRYVIKGANKTVTSTDTITMRAVRGGTEVAYTAEFEFRGVARLLEPALRIPLKRLGDDAEKSLRKALDRL